MKAQKPFLFDIQASPTPLLKEGLERKEIHIPHRIEKTVSRSCIDYEMIQEGDRILLGLSGGKDSTSLIASAETHSKEGTVCLSL